MTGGVTLDRTPAGVATLTLNRPELGNRYDGAMLAAMQQALAAVAADPVVRCLVLRGAGRHFCVGADIAWHAAPALAPAAPGLAEVLLALDALPRPVVGVVQGACIGGGLAFAACCDIVLAAEDAVFAIPEVRLGLAPAALLAPLLRAIGYRALRRYGLTGERFSAAAARRIGLVAELFAGDAAPVLAPLLEALCRGGPAALAQTKALAARRATPPLDAPDMRALDAAFADSLRTPEAQEGLAAFREKRPPAWYTPLPGAPEGRP